jgi:hypothetical protein
VHGDLHARGVRQLGDGSGRGRATTARNGDKDDGCTDLCKSAGVRRQLRAAEPGRAVRPRRAEQRHGGVHVDVQGRGVRRRADPGERRAVRRRGQQRADEVVQRDVQAQRVRRRRQGAGEACDDGNQSNDDTCTNVCKLATCGDGFKQPGEQCDLGVNNSNTGMCTLQCKSPLCGDTVHPAEQHGGVRRRQHVEHGRVRGAVQERELRGHVHAAGRGAVRRREQREHGRVRGRARTCARRRRAGTGSCRPGWSSATTGTT